MVFCHIIGPQVSIGVELDDNDCLNTMFEMVGMCPYVDYVWIGVPGGCFYMGRIRRHTPSNRGNKGIYT